MSGLGFTGLGDSDEEQEYFSIQKDQKQKLSKQEIIYGIWGQEEDDDSEQKSKEMFSGSFQPKGLDGFRKGGEIQYQVSEVKVTFSNKGPQPLLGVFQQQNEDIVNQLQSQIQKGEGKERKEKSLQKNQKQKQVSFNDDQIETRYFTPPLKPIFLQNMNTDEADQPNYLLDEQYDFQEKNLDHEDQQEQDFQQQAEQQQQQESASQQKEDGVISNLSATAMNFQQASDNQVEQTGVQKNNDFFKSFLNKRPGPSFQDPLFGELMPSPQQINETFHINNDRQHNIVGDQNLKASFILPSTNDSKLLKGILKGPNQQFKMQQNSKINSEDQSDEVNKQEFSDQESDKNESSQNDNNQDSDENEEEVSQNSSSQENQEDGDDENSQKEGNQLQLTKEQLRRRKILEFKQGTQQTGLFNMPNEFGARKKYGHTNQQKWNDSDDQEDEENDSETEGDDNKNQTKMSQSQVNQEEGQLKANYGKGFSMLQKLGYKTGEGLGLTNQGRAQPIEAFMKNQMVKRDDPAQLHKNAKKDASYEAKQNQLLKDFNLDDKENQKEEDDDNQVQVNKRIWQKGPKKPDFQKGKKAGNNNNNKNMRYFSQTERGEDSGHQNFQKQVEIANKPDESQIIDMRGTNINTYLGFGEVILNSNLKNVGVTIDQNQDIKNTKFQSTSNYILEIQNNKDIIESKIRANDKKISNESNKIVTLKFEIDKYDREKTELATRLTVYQELKQTLNKLIQVQKGSGKESMSFLDIIASLKQPLKRTPQEFFDLNLDLVYVKASADFLKNRFNQLAKEQHITTKEQSFKGLLMEFQHIHTFLTEMVIQKEDKNLRKYGQEINQKMTLGEQYRREFDRYLQFILNKSFNPFIREWVTNQWVPTDSESDMIIDLIDQWKEYLNKEALAELFNSLIVPQLYDSLKNWNIVKQGSSCHLWIFPWLQVIPKDHLSTIWQLMTNKLTMSLSEWDPMELGIFNQFEPWVRVLDEQMIDNFIIRNVVPQMMYLMEELEINPADQKIDAIKVFLQWAEVLKPNFIIMILQGTLIDKLKGVIIEWRKQEGYQQNEMVVWFKGWMRILNSVLLQSQELGQRFKELQQNYLQPPLSQKQ